MSQSELLVHTLEALAQSSSEYMLTGSFVSSMQGEPRATQDIDFVVTGTAESIEAFLSRFSLDDYYYSADAAKRAMSSGGMFNIISNAGDKVDIWALTDSEFDQSRFSRRQSVEFFGRQLNISSPEDTILMKLRWSEQSGGSEKQLFDAAKVYDMQQEIIDAEYIASWIQKLNLEDQFAAMQRFL
jgi:hypothetical protein